MNDLLERISYEKDWREKELSLLKKLSSNPNFINNKNFQLLFKYSIPMIYAIWEGFLKDVLMNYAAFINRNDKLDSYDLTILTNILEQKNKIRYIPKDFDKKKEMVSFIQKVIENPLFDEKRPYVMGLNFKKSNELLSKFNLPPLDTKNSIKLNNLKKQRDNIAHGEQYDGCFEDLLVNIRDYVDLVLVLMDEVYINIDDIVRNL